MMIGEGRVKAYINCYTANSGYTNVSRRFRAAIEAGKLTYEDYSQDVLMLQLHAASLGLPLDVYKRQGLNRAGSLGQQGMPSNMTRYCSGKGVVVPPALIVSSRSLESSSNASAAAVVPRAVTTSAMWLNRSKPL